MSDEPHTGRGRRTTRELTALFHRLAGAQDRALVRRPTAVETAAVGESTSETALGIWQRAQDLEEKAAHKRRLLRLAGAAAALALMAGGVVGFALVQRGRPEAAAVTARETAVQAAPSTHLFTAADTELPLHFADGSSAVFAPGSSGRVLGIDARGADVELAEGRVNVHVVHAAATRWTFHAGPFAVHVTGTRFALAWSARRLAVTMHEGSVTVDGAVLGAGVPLRRGQALHVALDEGTVRTESVDVDVPEAAAATQVEPLGVLPRERNVVVGKNANLAANQTWLTLAERGAHAEAFRAAEALGLAHLEATLTAPDLLTLGDVARYAGRPTQARAIFAALVARFATHPLAADAVFSLGRMAFEAGDLAAADAWFARYERHWPDGALKDEASARRQEIAARGPVWEARPARPGKHERTGKDPGD